MIFNSADIEKALRERKPDEDLVIKAQPHHGHLLGSQIDFVDGKFVSRLLFAPDK